MLRLNFNTFIKINITNVIRFVCAVDFPISIFKIVSAKNKISGTELNFFKPREDVQFPGNFDFSA